MRGRVGPMNTGAALLQKPTNFKASLRRFAGQLKPERRIMVIVFICAAVSVFLSVLGPKVLGHGTNIIFEGAISKTIPEGVTQEQFISQLQSNGDQDLAQMVSAMQLNPGHGIDFQRLGLMISLAIVVYSLSFMFGWWQGRLVAIAVQRSTRRLREQVSQKITRIPLKYLDNQQRGDLLSRVTNDVDNVQQTMQQTLSQLIMALLTVVGVLTMMLLISPVLALVTIIIVPVSLFGAAFIAKRSQPQFVAQWASTGKVNAQVEETITGHEIVHAFGQRKAVFERFDAENEKMFQASFKAQFISGIVQPLMAFLGNLNYVVVAVFGGLQVASGGMSLGDVQAFIQYSRQFTMPLTQIASVINLLQSGLASMERVFEVLDAPEESLDAIAGQGGQDLTQARGAVTFEQVAFSYKADTPLIENLNLEVSPGQSVAIVGPTGAGKTTLVNLLLRFYDVDAGRITLDGVDIRNLTRAQLRGHIGMVLQDTWLFEGTIKDNLLFGLKPGTTITDEDFERAVKATHVDSFVQTLPEGYDTVLDDERSALSAGEKQLLTIARAFLSDPAILVLDEATSSVDTRTEVLVQEAMGELRKGRTSFVIAHRLSTIRDADVILYLENGQVLEQGNHQQLLATGGAYARLYNSQFAK